MPVPLLNANAAPAGAALWLQMIQEQGGADNSPMPSGQLHGRLTGTRGITADVVDYAYNMSDEELVNWIRTLRDRAESIMQA
jgi:hypothetical protein